MFPPRITHYRSQTGFHRSGNLKNGLFESLGIFFDSHPKLDLDVINEPNCSKGGRSADHWLSFTAIMQEIPGRANNTIATRPVDDVSNFTAGMEGV